MKNKTILLGILAIFIIIFVFYGYFSSSFFSDFKEGLADPLDPNTQNIIVGLINGRIRPDNPDANLTDETILANIKLLGSPNSQITDILSSNLSSKEAVDKFAALFGQGVYDPLADGLVIHYTFDNIKTIGGQTVIENKSTNWIPSNPNKYNAVVHQGANNKQVISTILDKTNTAVNPSCLNLAGLPRSDPKTNGSTDNGAYLMIPTIPTCYDSTGFLGMTFSLWFLATEKCGEWCRIFDFANDRDSDNILMTPSSGNSQCFATYMVNNRWNPAIPYWGDYACDSNWRHVVWTISKKGVWAIYINNQVVSKEITLLPTNIIRKRNYIGRSNWNQTANPPYYNDDMYNGKIDDFRMYQRELLPEEIGMLYAKGGKVQQKNNQFWVMPDTQNKWYENGSKLRRSMGKLTDLGILSNTQMTVAFWINVTEPYWNWRNIFAINNGQSTDCYTDGCRIPSLWIYPSSGNHHGLNLDKDVILHYRHGTLTNWNDGLKPGGNGVFDYDPDIRFPIGKDTHVTFTTSGKTLKYFLNGVLKYTRTLDNSTRFSNNNSNAQLMMNMHDGGYIKLKNFQMFNRALSDTEVMGVYNQVVCQY
jgi:hypothetical protein